MSEPTTHPIDDTDTYYELDAAGNGTGARTPWSYEQESQAAADPDEAARREAVKQRAEEVATALASARLSNGDPSNAPHFLRISQAGEVCGQCGEAFPCDAYQATHHVTTDVVGRTRGQEADDDRVANAATLLGMSMEELRAALA